jgi:AbrB family looped-hinge helix DNA binding protein
MVAFTTKGQIVIPARIRKEFEIKSGTRAAVVSTPEGILLKPVTREYIRGMRGSAKGKKVWDAFQEDRSWEREH